MSLMQLLTVTRSIKTVKDQPSPYKMKQDHLLPRFSTPKGEAEDDLAGMATRHSKADVMPSPVPKGFFQRWLGLGGGWGRKKTRGRLPVQTELLLGAVRVVRNDFQESNVFSGEMRGRGERVPRTRAAAGQWWLRIQTRLFGQHRKQM